MVAQPDASISEAKATAIDLTISDQDLRVPCYCEENVWRLLVRKLHYEPIEAYVVFISNEHQSVAMLNQKAAKRSDIVCWDYHVILLCHEQETSPDQNGSTTTNDSSIVVVYDVDTTLQPFPIPLAEYLKQSFPSKVPDMYRPNFRIVRGDIFCDWFSSDRRHMRNGTHQWSATPPPYACISTASTTNPHTLEQYIRFHNGTDSSTTLPNQALGIVVNLDTMMRFDQWKTRLM